MVKGLGSFEFRAWGFGAWSLVPGSKGLDLGISQNCSLFGATRLCRFAE